MDKADHISLSILLSVNFSWPDGPVWTVLGPCRQYRWLIVSAYHYVWVSFSCTDGTSLDSPWYVELNPSIQYG